jgi:IstB-like ATP binding protein
VHLSDLDFTVARGLSKAKFLERAGGKWVQDHLNLITVGATGGGTAFLSSGLADPFCTLGHPVRYFQGADLRMELKFALIRCSDAGPDTCGCHACCDALPRRGNRIVQDSIRLVLKGESMRKLTSNVKTNSDGIDSD